MAIDKTNILFKILVRINPLIALFGTFCLATLANHKVGWLLLMIYNLSNIYVYTVKRRDFWAYAIVSFLHFSFGLWAVFN